MSKKTLEQFIKSQGLPVLLTNIRDSHPEAELYLVGGAVRDAMIGRDVKDIDVVISGIPEQKLEDVLSEYGRVKKIGRRFGVFQFQSKHIANGLMLDIALPRTEQATLDNVGGYREFETRVDHTIPIKDDLSRRDFTVNAMAYSVRKKILIDPFGGQSDLGQNTIRAVGNPKKRLREDLSRLLRAVRFAVQLSFEIEPDTFTAIRALASEINKKYPDQRFVVPREVVGKELAKALIADPKLTLILLYKTGLGHELAPALTNRLITNPARIKNPGACTSLTVIIALFLAIIPPGKRVRFLKLTGLQTLPRDGDVGFDKKTARWIAGQLDRGYENPLKSEPADFEQRWMNESGRAYKQVLLALGHERVAEAVNQREKKIRNQLGVSPRESIPELVDGNDALEYIESGPRIGQVLHEIRNAQLSGELKTREEALTYLDKQLR